MPKALVTGATVGIGEAFARHLAADGYDLVLLARNEKALQSVADSLSVKTEVLRADLDDDADLARVEERLREPDIDLLVNNAGFGTNGDLHEIDIAQEESMLRVNVRAVLRLTAAVLPGMVDRGSGSIVNVSSMAGFAPGTGAATYAASKAYVTMLSQSLAATYEPHGVKVLAVCPGFTVTEFHKRSGAPPSVPKWMWLNTDHVVSLALKDLAAGKRISIAGWPYKTAKEILKYTPEPALKLLSGGFRSRRGRA